jgi:phosphonate transport system substrate-binding protein
MERLGTGRTDVAPLGAVNYALGHEAYGIEARLVNGRYDTFGYRSQISVRADGGYADIWDLQGARFASPDPGSTSSYQLPYLLVLETTGMALDSFFGEVLFSGSHRQVIRDVYSGTADCGATYEDARASVVAEYPDVYDVVSVLTYTEFMPNDGWAVRPGLEESLVQTLSNGIIAVASTAEGQSGLEPLLGPLTSIATTDDSAYDVVRRLADEFGWQMSPPCHRTYLPIVLESVGSRR